MAIYFRLSFGVGWVAWVQARHGGGRQTRALQHHDQVNPSLRRRNIKDGPRKAGGSAGRAKTHADFAGRKNQSKHWGGIRRYIFRDPVRIRLLTD